MSPRSRQALMCGVAVGVLLLSAYLAVRLATTLTSVYVIPAAIVAALLLAAEAFVAVQTLGYFASLVKATRHRDPAATTMFSRCTFPAAPVAVLVTSFNESEEVLDETLASVRAMDYAAVSLYLVDDSTRDATQAAARLAERYGARLVHRTNRPGYKAGAINDLIPALTEPYIAVLDADQRPAHSWLREVVPMLEADPRLAFVQAPQVSVNTAGLPVARAAAHQQAVFYEYICEGKDASNAMFCCGSNVVLRREALLSIEVCVDGRRHFMDETSVTEDFATSFRLHAHGWRSSYVNRTYVVGMAPETLAAYFTQQARWAMGTLGMLLVMLRQLAHNPRALRPGQWSEYLLSGMHYLVGGVNLIFMSTAIGFLLFDLMPVRMDPHLYVALFVPYFVISMGLFFGPMKRRGYPLGGLWLGTVLTFGSFWVFIKATGVALLGLKRAFGVTPKAVGGSLPLRSLAPQVVMFVLCSAAAAVGLAQIVTGRAGMAHFVTTGWAMYHAALLGTLLVYFNRPVTIRVRPAIIERVNAASPRRGRVPDNLKGGRCACI